MRSDQLMTAGGFKNGVKFWRTLLENDGAFLRCYILQAELSLGSPERVGN